MKTPSLILRRSCALCNPIVLGLLTQMLLDRPVIAATALWGGSSGNWSDATKWNSNPNVPINVNGGLTWDATVNSGNVSVDAGITIENLTLGGGVIVVTNNLTANAGLTFSSGAFIGASTLNIGGPTVWTDGTFGTNTVNLNGGLTMSGAATKNVDKTVNNTGAASWTGGTLKIGAGADGVFNNGDINHLGASFTTDFDGSMIRNFTGTFNNGGTFIKSGGTGSTTTELVAFNNTGIVNINSGTLALQGGGTSSGIFNIAAGKKLQITLSRSYTMDAGTQLLGSGTLETNSDNAFVFFNGPQVHTANFLISAGSLTFNAQSNVSTSGGLTMSGGGIGGTGTVSIGGPVVWTGGTISTGVANLNGALAMSGGGTKSLGKTVNNQGTATWTGGNFQIGGDAVGVFNNTRIKNVDAMFTTDFDGTISQNFAGTFNNAGIFTKSGGTGTTSVSPSFNNTGTVNVNSGTLALQGTVTQLPGSTLTGGTWNVTNGATLSITSGSSINTIGIGASVTLDGAGSTFNRLPAASSGLATNLGGLTLKNDRHFTTAGAFTNSGSVTVQDSTTALTIGSPGLAAYTQTAGSTTLTGGATLSASTFSLNGGMLRGTGTLSATFTSNGVIQPGLSAGRLTINGSTTFGSGSELRFELGGLVAGTQYDQIIVNAAVVLGGALHFEFIDGFESLITSGASFTVLTANALSGAFVNAPNGSRVTNAAGTISLTVNYGPGSAFAPNSIVLSDVVAYQPVDAVNDTQEATAAAMVIGVLANDSVQAPYTLISAVTQGAHGSVVISGSGTVTYTPGSGFTGNDSFTYTILNGAYTDTATVTVQDTIAPTITGTFSPLSVVAGTLLPDYTAQAVTSDAVGVTSVTQSPAPGTILTTGSLAVTLTAHDAAGHTASTSFTISVPAPGDLNLAFGGTGKVTTDFGAGNDLGQGMVIQRDGKAVVAGYSTQGGVSSSALARYMPNGSLDTSFGSGGRVTTSVGTRSFVGRAVALQSDGKIVAAGDASGGTDPDMALIRFNADGSVDSTFGPDHNGVVQAKAGQLAVGKSVVIQSDAKIVVAGYYNTGPVFGSKYGVAVFRYDSDGNLDPSFNGTGKVTARIGTGDSYGDAVAVQNDGKIVVTGYSVTGSNHDMVVLRYLPNGSLDSGFNGTGIVSTAIGSVDERALCVALQSDGKIIVGGYSILNAGGNTDFAVVRYLPDGRLDTSFGGTGMVTTAIGTGSDVANGVTLQSDGKIVLAGKFSSGTVHGFALARYNVDGSLDTDFSGDGKVTTPIAGGSGSLHAVQMRNDGTILAAGYSSNGGLNDFAVAAYHSGLGAAPEISVQQPVGTELTHTQSEVDFGLVDAGSSATRTFTITNTGFANLTGLAVTADGSGSADYTLGTLGTLGAVTLAPLASTTFTVTLTPGAPGPRVATLRIASNDGDEPSFEIVMKGARRGDPGAVGFSASSYTVNQGATSVVLTLNRVNGSQATTVTIQTDNGTASGVPPFTAAVATTDYSDLSGAATTVSFADGELSKDVTVTLTPRTGTTIPNTRLTATLSAPTSGTVLGAITTTTVNILANDTTNPTLMISTPSATVSALSPYMVTGIAGDLRGIARVMVSLNGSTPVAAALGAAPSPLSVPFSLAIAPVQGTSMVVVTAYDLRGNSTTASRTFTFTHRYLLTLTRAVPAAVSATPDTAGTLALAAVPVANASPLASAPANLKTSNVVPATSVKLTATAKPGYAFSHWQGLPAGAVELGNVATFAMPGGNAVVTAVFVVSPFAPAAGEGSAFHGLIHPIGPTSSSNATQGFLTGTLNASTGAFSGKVVVGGLTQPIVATFFGDGSVLFTVGTTMQASLNFGGRSLTLSYNAGAGNNLISANLFNGVDISSGTASRAKYSATSKVPAVLLNSSTQGYYTIAFPAIAQIPARNPASYPQGDGFGSITVSNAGVVSLTGTLADGTAVSASSALVAGNTCPIFAQLATPGSAISKGGSFGGVLTFNPSPADSDVTGTDLLWFRPAVTAVTTPAATAAATNLYTSGWPDGINVVAVGALYNAATNVQTALALGPPNPVTGNGKLIFADGKLTSLISKTNFNISGNTVAKIPTTDASFTLALVPATGGFSGTFTPNWASPATTKPAFKGILLQKGANKGGFGFFLSNAVGDLDPQGGGLTLSNQN